MFQKFTRWVLGIEKEIDRRVQLKLTQQQAYLLDQYHQRIENTYVQINNSVGKLYRITHELRKEMEDQHLLPKADNQQDH